MSALGLGEMPLEWDDWYCDAVSMAGILVRCRGNGIKDSELLKNGAETVCCDSRQSFVFTLGT